MTNLEVHVWSDVACPWCWVGLQRYNAAVAKLGRSANVSTKFHAYMIDPATKRTGDSLGLLARNLRRSLAERICCLAAGAIVASVSQSKSVLVVCKGSTRFSPHYQLLETALAFLGEEYLAYNKRRWGSDAWTGSLRASGKPHGAAFKDWKWWPHTLKVTVQA